MTAPRLGTWHWMRVWRSPAVSETPKRQIMSLSPSERGGLWEPSSFDGFWRGNNSFKNQWPVTVFFAGYRSIFLEGYSDESAI